VTDAPTRPKQLKAFISYNRACEEIARQVVDDLRTLGNEVWFDQALPGGQAWWDFILQEIRDCDVLVFLLYPGSLNSIACTREREYAVALGKKVLPLQVADTIAMNLLPSALARVQIIQYRTGDRAEALRFAWALAAMPKAPALPSPLPEPPEEPMSELAKLAQQVAGTATLSDRDQKLLLLELKELVSDPETAVEARELLVRLQKRRDLLHQIGLRITEILGELSGTTPKSKFLSIPPEAKASALDPQKVVGMVRIPSGQLHPGGTPRSGRGARGRRGDDYA
jgi:hypothetical protein